MGMFDYVRCEMPLPDGFEGKNMQTKDLGCTMSTVTITKDGRLTGRVREWWWEEYKPVRDLDFHGDMTFYDYEGDINGSYVWHEYVARFTEGQLVSIRISRDSDRSGEAVETTGSTEGESAGPTAIAQLSSEPTP